VIVVATTQVPGKEIPGTNNFDKKRGRRKKENYTKRLKRQKFCRSFLYSFKIKEREERTRKREISRKRERVREREV